MKGSDLEALFAAVYSDLAAFCELAFTTIHPGRELLWNYHIDAIVHVLTNCLRGKLRRLNVNLPPRYLKSFLISVALPAFALGRDPAINIICVSYSDELARKHTDAFNRLIKSEWYAETFAKTKTVRLTANETTTTQNGSRYATSIHGSLTGRGADIIIVDDPLNADDALSEAARRDVIEWYGNVLISRLNDKQRGVVINVMQRLHVNDLSGYLIETGGYQTLSFPAIAQTDEVIELGNGRTHTRHVGDVLHPNFESLESLDEIKRSMGSASFAAQYLQRPETPEGYIFRKEYFEVLDKPPENYRQGQLYLSIDPAYTDGPRSDYSSLLFVRGLEENFYVMNAVRGRWQYEDLKKRVLYYRERCGPDLILFIEAVGAGISLIQFLRDAGINCISDHPGKVSKEGRAMRALPVVEQRRIKIVSSPGNTWVEPFMNELMLFPRARNDDQVDSLVQLVWWARNRHRSSKLSFV